MENIVTFEQAIKLKDIGFNEYTWRTYSYLSKNLLPKGDIKKAGVHKNSELCKHFASAPTVSEALQWIRDNKGIACSVNLDQMMQDGNVRTYYVGFFIKDPRKISFGEFTSAFDTVTESESELLNGVLNYLEKSSGIRN